MQCLILRPEDENEKIHEEYEKGHTNLTNKKHYNTLYDDERGHK